MSMQGGDGMELGKQIKMHRQEAELSQEELANRVYVSRQTILNWENDKSYPDVIESLERQAAYGAVDLLVVGKFGSTAGLSVVSTGSQVLNLVTFVVIQLAMGITVLIARYIGEKKTGQIGEVLGGAAVVFTIISIGLFILMVCFRWKNW